MLNWVPRYYPNPYRRICWQWFAHWFNLRRLWRSVEDCAIRREYIKLTLDGTSCTMTPGDACDILQDSDDPMAYTVESVWMTPHQFDSMPEFMGW